MPPPTTAPTSTPPRPLTRSRRGGVTALPVVTELAKVKFVSDRLAPLANGTHLYVFTEGRTFVRELVVEDGGKFTTLTIQDAGGSPRDASGEKKQESVQFLAVKAGKPVPYFVHAVPARIARDRYATISVPDAGQAGWTNFTSALQATTSGLRLCPVAVRLPADKHVHLIGKSSNTVIAENLWIYVGEKRTGGRKHTFAREYKTGPDGKVAEVDLRTHKTKDVRPPASSLANHLSLPPDDEQGNPINYSFTVRDRQLPWNVIAATVDDVNPDIVYYPDIADPKHVVKRGVTQLPVPMREPPKLEVVFLDKQGRPLPENAFVYVGTLDAQVKAHPVAEYKVVAGNKLRVVDISSKSDTRPVGTADVAAAQLPAKEGGTTLRYVVLATRDQIPWADVQQRLDDDLGPKVYNDLADPGLLSGGKVTLNAPLQRECRAISLKVERRDDNIEAKTTIDPALKPIVHVVPKPSKAVALTLSSEMLDSFGEGATKDLTEALGHMENFLQSSKAENDWREYDKKKAREAVDKAQKNESWEVSGSLVRATEADVVQIMIETGHENCTNNGHPHPVEVMLEGAGAVPVKRESNGYSFKAKGLKTWKVGAANVRPGIYRVRLPSCTPGHRVLTSEVHVLPSWGALATVKWVPKPFNVAAKALSSDFLNTVLSPSVELKFELGALTGEVYAGWRLEDNLAMFVRELRVSAKPMVSAELTAKLSFGTMLTGIPPKLLDYIADIGVYLTIGGSVEAGLAYTYQRRYLEARAHHVVKGSLTGNIFVELGLYAKLGAKDILEVAVTAGVRAGLTFPFEFGVDVGENITGRWAAEFDQVKLKVALRTKIAWVFSYNKAKEWNLTDAKKVLKGYGDPVEIYKFT